MTVELEHEKVAEDKVAEEKGAEPPALLRQEIARMRRQMQRSIRWVLAAAAVVVTIPIVLLVLAFQRRIVAGLTAGAVKG